MKSGQKLSKSILPVALVTVLILMVPLVAMQFTNEVNWSAFDFFGMGALLFGTGMLIAVAIRSGTHIAYRAGMLIAIGATFLMIWANLAVGLIGAGPHAGNLMYAGVIWVIILGIYFSRFKPAGMERTMFATAGSLILLLGIALLAGMQNYPGSSVGEIIGVNLFFATPYAVAGLIFRYVRLEQNSTKEVAS